MIASAAVPAYADSIRDASWHLGFLHVADAHKATQGDGIVVAVVDTGVDASHPDLAGNVLPGLDAYDEHGNGQRDANGHGTAVASIIAGHGHGSGEGVLGIAPKAKILPINVTTPRSPLISPKAVGQAIRYAVDHRAGVVCVAIAGAFDPEQAGAVQYATAHHVLVVAAAGNKGDLPLIGNPAAIKDAVAVSSVDRNGNLAPESLTGPELDIAAPGVDIEAAVPGGRYGKINGTSPAAAIVAGTVALIRASHPHGDEIDQLQRLAWTATDHGPPGRDTDYGWGVLDAAAAVSKEPTPPPDPAASGEEFVPPPPMSHRADPRLRAGRIVVSGGLIGAALFLIGGLSALIWGLRRRRAQVRL